MNFNISIVPKENISDIIPLLSILNPTMNTETLQERVAQISLEPYYCVAIYDGEKMIGLSGFWILYKIYAGKHIEPDNVIIHPDYRNKGLGEKLLDWVHEYGRGIGCNTSEINCFTANHPGYKFWINQGYEIIGFHMIKRL